MLAMTAGFLSILLWPTLPSYWVACSFLVLAIILLKTHHLAASFIAGLSICIISINIHFTDLKTLLPANSSIKGEIVSLPVQGKHHNRFYFELSQINDRNEVHKSNSRIQVIWPGQHKLNQGQRLALTIKAKPLVGLFNQGTFNYQRFLVSNNVIATVSVIDGKIIAESTNLRAQLALRFDEVSDNYKSMRFMRALVIGDKRYFNQHDWKVLQYTGTSHLFAISGLHLGFVCLMAMMIIRPLIRMCIRHNHLATLCIMGCTIFVGFFYSLLAGFSYPTVRALVMLIVASCFVCLAQRVAIFQIIAITLFIIGLVNPLGFLSQGLWLSLFALICVVTCSKWFASRAQLETLNFRSRVVQWVGQLLKLQLMLVIGLCGIQMLFFGGVSLIAPFANIVAVPVITLIVLPIGLLATLCDQLSLFQLADWGFHVTDTVLTLLFELLTWISNANFVWQGIAASRWLVLIIISFSMILILKIVNAKYSLYMLCFIMAIVFGLICNSLHTDVKAWRVDFLDVGHGNSSVIQKGNRAMVIDTGNVLGEHSTMAQNIVIPFIAQREIAHVDYILVTHHDSDHSAGLKSLLERFPLAQVITNRDAICNGGYFEWQGLAIKLTKALGKLPKSHETENNRSCLIHIKNEFGSALFSGDIERRAEKLLVNQLDKTWQAKVLQVPHHGSKTSSSVDFIDLVSPQLAIVSTASFNQWHFPASLVMSRYRRASTKLINTAEVGQITVEFRQAGPYIINYRRQRSPFWYNGDLSFGHYQR